jgi:TolA-binding protein
MKVWLPEWRVGENQSVPDTAIMEQLQEKAMELEQEIAELQGEIEHVDGDERWRRQHKIYVKQRESLEFRLSYLLNQRKRDQNGQLNEAYLFDQDPEIAELGSELNNLRIKRRIFDYVIEALPDEPLAQ